MLFSLLSTLIFLLHQSSVPRSFVALPKPPLAVKEMSLLNRQPNSWVNEVFRDNILLTLKYLQGHAQNVPIDWNEVSKSNHFELSLSPGATFAFHDDVLPSYQESVTQTTNAHFNTQEGFKSDGYLVGDGVCHLASLLNWVARAANLKVEAPTAHDFAVIPEIPKEFGVAIYDYPGHHAANATQNLYITNPFNKPVAFVFDYSAEKIKVSIKS